MVVKFLGAMFLAVTLLACGLHFANSGSSPLPPPPPGTMRVATHNVHYILLNKAEGAWSVADWHRRKAALDQAFKTAGADIHAFQEMESFAGGDDDSVNLARTYLLQRNPGYAAAAIGDWRAFPSTQPVLYRKDRFTLMDQGWFFFSETPDVIYSRTFDGSYPAFASWVRFAPTSGGDPFIVFNIHLDYSSRTNRNRSTALIVERLSPLIDKGEKVLLLGDLNAFRRSATVRALQEAGITFAPVPGATYHLNWGFNLFGAIDHIATAGGLHVTQGPVVLQRKFGGAWPSDHYPVVADIGEP